MDPLDRAKKLVEESENILIVPSRQTSGDSLSSALALLFTLRKMGKNVNILSEEIPENFRFLSDLEPAGSRDFVISINGSEKEIGEMRYEKNENGLRIYLTLNRGEINEKDISFPAPDRNPDLLITLGVESSEDLSFYQVPILNIGEIGAKDSLAETSMGLIKTIDAAPIDKNVATCLLTGIICASQNFHRPKTRPKTFEAAAHLIESGADHQKIIQHLYRQKNIAQIKILGKVLKGLNLDKEKELYYATLTEKDFRECGARPKDLAWAIEELKFSFRYLPNLLILWESRASPIVIRGIFYSVRPGFVEKILDNCQGVSKGEGALFLVKDSDLNSAKEKILRIL